MLNKLKSIPLSSVFISLAGIIVGLVIGFLASIPIDKMPYDWAWAISVGIYVVAIILMAILFLSRREMIIEVAGRVWPHRLLATEQDSSGGHETPVDEKNEPEDLDWSKVMLLDTSAIIDGRIADIVRTGFIDGTLVVTSFILNELQRIADAASAVKRNRGRRGLEILEELQKEEFVPFRIWPYELSDTRQVDSTLVNLASEKGAKVITTDFNLNKVGKVRGVRVLNINELANMVKTILVPGEQLTVKVIQQGKEEDQGVAYLPDGTMIVVEDGAGLVGRKVKVVVQRLFQTEAGRMIFVRRLT